MTVWPEPDNGEIDAAILGDHPFDPRGFGSGIGGRRVECVDAIFGNAERLQQLAAQPK
jgi:hypothetical protein